MQRPTIKNTTTTTTVHRRSGATVVESAIVLPILLFIIFAMLDLGLAAIRYNALAEVSRRIARAAVIHGSTAPDMVGNWGPDTYTGTAADDSEMVAAALNTTTAMPDDQVTIQISWPDGDNSPRDRVHVEVAYEHQPLLPALFPWGPFVLRSETTMRVVN